MNRKHLALALVLIGLVAAYLTIKDRSRPKAANGAGDGNGLFADEAAAGETLPRFRIVSETLTSTGMVYVVMKGGVTNTVTIPETMQLTPEEIEQVVFPAEDPSSHAQRLGPGRNPMLVFYGIAVDESTNGLSGASVEANVMLGEPSEGLRRELFHATTAEDGRFELQIPWGQQMMVTVTNNTNYIAPPSQWFQFGPVGDRPIHQPDPGNPVPFVFHRVLPAEPLVETGRWWGAPNTGEPVRIDLTTGEKVVEGGDLIVSIRCPEPYSNLKQFPWELNVEVVDGGLLAADAERLEFMHEAPATGYQNRFQLEFGPSSSNYRRQYDGMFFVKSRNGAIHAKLQFKLRLHWDERGVPFGIHAFVNTNGSRYLQNAGP